MSPNRFSYQFNQTKYLLYIHLKLINEGANMSFRYYANTGDSHHYNDQDVVVRSGRTLSTVSVLAFFSATIFDIPNICTKHPKSDFSCEKNEFLSSEATNYINKMNQQNIHLCLTPYAYLLPDRQPCIITIII